MKKTVEVIARIEAAPKVVVEFAEGLMLMLDCHVCQRTRRSVIIRPGDEPAFCTPTRHDFPARLLAKAEKREGGIREVVYTVAYESEPFQDAKYPQRTLDEEVRWGRVSFQVTCPRCSQVKEASTQNNIVRPWICFCKCGEMLYEERDEMPRFVAG